MEEYNDLDSNLFSSEKSPPHPEKTESRLSTFAKISTVFTMWSQCLAVTFTIAVFPFLFAIQFDESLDFYEYVSQNKSNRHIFSTSLHRTTLILGIVTISHPLVYILSMFAVVPSIRRMGVSSVTLLGTFIVLLAFSCMATYPKFWVLLLARAIQGAGTALALGATMARVRTSLADPSTAEDRILAFVMVANGLGTGLGPLFGGGLLMGLSFNYIFLCMVCVIAIDMVIQIIAFVPPRKVNTKVIDYMQALRLLNDPYMLVGLGTSILIVAVVSGILTYLPIWIFITQIDANPLLVGLVVLPTAFTFVIGNFCSTILLSWTPSWILSIVGLLFTGLSVIILSFEEALFVYIVGMIAVGLGEGICIASIIPLLTRVVDRRHNSEESYLFALTELAEQVGAFLGPLIGLALLQVVQFSWFIRIMALSLAAWSFSQCVLRNPPSYSVEKKSLIEVKR